MSSFSIESLSCGQQQEGKEKSRDQTFVETGKQQQQKQQEQQQRQRGGAAPARPDDDTCPPKKRQRGARGVPTLFAATCWIWFFSCEPSLVVTDAAITGRETPHERPSACLFGTKT